MHIIIGSDHRGFKLKEYLKKHLIDQKLEVTDVGADAYNQNDDYTLYAEKVAVLVAHEKNSKGILLCGSGVGVDIVANKFNGIRASIGFTKDQIVAGRMHDNMNVLIIAADFMNKPQSLEILNAFLETEYDQKERHQRRIDEIARIEENN